MEVRKIEIRRKNRVMSTMVASNNIVVYNSLPKKDLKKERGIDGGHGVKGIVILINHGETLLCLQINVLFITIIIHNSRCKDQIAAWSMISNV